jgi:hypothetical protein
MGEHMRVVGRPVPGARCSLSANGREVHRASRIDLHRCWSEVSFRMQSLRDNPACASEEYERLLDAEDPGLHARLSFRAGDDVAAPYISTGARPAIAVLREQGVNSQTEMAAVFTARRLRCLRRAHDRHPQRAACASRAFHGSGRLRRVFLRRRARRRRGLGQIDSVQCARAR